MLVLLAPDFDGTAESLQRLADLTGLVPYDLKSRVRPGQWGVLKLLADREQALELTRALARQGFKVALVDPQVAHDAERRVVRLESIDVLEEHMVLHLGRRDMEVRYPALLTIVRGEVRPGRASPRTSSTSTSSMRMLAPSAAEVAVFRESVQQATEGAYPAADLHFHTASWVARIDARHFDFSSLEMRSDNAALDLRTLTEVLASRSGAKIDDSIRKSSLGSFAGRPPPMRAQSSVPAGVGEKDDFQFTAYSRLVAAAERELRGPSWEV